MKYDDFLQYFIVGLPLIVISSVIGLLILLVKRKNRDYEITNVDMVEIYNIIEWFKQEDNLLLLKKNNSYNAILFKSYDSNILGKNMKKYLKDKKLSSYNNTLYQIIYDKANNKIIKYRIIYFNKLSEELINQFENKDMIIFD